MAFLVRASYTNPDNAWWREFYEWAQKQYPTECPLDRALAEAGGRDIPNSPYIEFKTKADATAFILKWS